MSNYLIIFLAFCWRQIRYVLRNPMVVFVYGILSKWYIMIFATAIIVTFFVFKGLEKSGVLQGAEDIVSHAFLETKAVAKICVPKIANLEQFWQCLQSDSLVNEYNRSNQQDGTDLKNEENLQKGLEGISTGLQRLINQDPYSAEDGDHDNPAPSAPPAPE